MSGASPSFGLTLSSEEHPPRRLVDLAELAERSGFDFVSISDHFHPWVEAQGHSPFVWGVLGAIAERTEHIDVAVGVTCPTVRIHPAVLAQATATAALLFGDRFTWGVGSGEALNEHILGDRWPPAPVRLAMLREAVDVIRQLWRGDVVDFDGDFYRVENARLYDVPEHPVPIVVSAFGPVAAEVAAEIGDGLWTGGDPGIVDRYRSRGGTGPVYSQVTLSWGATEDAEQRALERWPNGAIPGQLSQDLPTPQHFEEAARLVTRERIAEEVPCGTDAGRVVDIVRRTLAAGIDHLYLHQIGDDQEAFCRAWQTEIEPELVAAGVCGDAERRGDRRPAHVG